MSTNIDQEEYKKRKPILSIKGKALIFLGAIFSLFLFKVGKAKAIAPLAAWLIAMGGSYVIGEAVNYFGLNPLNSGGGFGATMTGSGVGAALLWAFNWLLYAVLALFSKLLLIGGFLLDATIKPDFFKMLISENPGTYEIWKFVRDFFNLFFVLVLLFSAFCTIFQVEKYHLKKILLTLVIMALLVNFSFPVSLFIIDASNVLMYFFVNGLFSSSDSSVSSAVAGLTGIGDILTSVKISGNWATTTYLLMAIIFVFVLMLTILAYGLNLLIRLVALTVLVILSPIGFALAIFPDTKNYANSWWANMFKYSFMGPILVFFLYLALKVLSSVPTIPGVTTSDAKVMLGGDSQTLVPLAAYYAIPTVFLWFGLAASLKMGGAASGIAMNFAKKAGNWAKGLPWRTTKRLAVATGIPGGMKQAADYYRKKGAPGFLKKIPGLGGKEAVEEREAKLSGFLTKGKAGMDAAGRNIKRKRVAEKLDEIKKFKVSKSEAVRNLSSTDEIERIAHALYLSEKNLIDTATEFGEAMKAVSSDPELQKEITDKVKKDNKVKVLVDYDIANGKLPVDAWKDNLKGMTPKKLAEQKDVHTDVNFHAHMLTVKAADPAFVRNAAKELSYEDKQNWRTATIIP